MSIKSKNSKKDDMSLPIDRDPPQRWSPPKNVQSIDQEFTVTVKLKDTYIRKMSTKEIGQWVKDELGGGWKSVKVEKVEET